MEQTYEISAQDAFRIYYGNEKFRNILSKGGFVYCENRFVINHKKYITHKDGKMVLTDYAKTHESECCLIFDLVLVTE